MFTGIIEATGIVREIRQEGSNTHFVLECPFTSELKTDQSVAHDGVCLTVVAINGPLYTVTAVEETLQRTTLRSWTSGRRVNLERSMKLGDRLDGHLVQGHVDLTGQCTRVEERDGSWMFSFSHPSDLRYFTVPKGSITINGVSLTVVESRADGFTVTIIPYTFDHTGFSRLKAGDLVNLEFDVLGKYISRYLELTKGAGTTAR
jgi:riboflavin synthase